jgi:hypothetical protein
MIIRATATLTATPVDLASTTFDVTVGMTYGADIGAK